MIAKKHSYKPIYQFARFVNLLFATLFILLSLFLIFVLIRDIVSGNSIEFQSFLKFMNYLFWIGIWSPIIFIWVGYLYTDIDTDNEGIRFSFFEKPFLIKWDEVEIIKPIRPLNLFTRRNANVVLVKTKLTLIHRLYGLFYGNANKPAIIVFKNISDYDLLLKNVSVAARKNKGSK